MIAMGMMQPSAHEVIDMVAMGHDFVPTGRAMLVRAARLRRALHGIGGIYWDHVLVNVILVHVVKMAVMEIIDMAFMADRRPRALPHSRGGRRGCRVPFGARIGSRTCETWASVHVGGRGHTADGSFAAYAAWSARVIELQALATLATLAQISTPSAAHLLNSHRILVQKFAADRNRQKGHRTALCESLPDQRQALILMERRRGRQRPFQRRRAHTPRVSGSFGLSTEGISNANEKYDQAQGGDVGPDRRDVVPVGKSVGIIRNPSRHSRQTEEMLGEEREVDADEGQPEMQLSHEFRIGVARHLRKPVVPASEDGES